MQNTFKSTQTVGALYLENLSFWNFILSFFLIGSFRLVIKQKWPIYYIKDTYLSVKLIRPFCQIFGINIARVNFKMTDIKDGNGELLRIRIPRQDLLAFVGWAVKTS